MYLQTIFYQIIKVILKTHKKKHSKAFEINSVSLQIATLPITRVVMLDNKSWHLVFPFLAQWSAVFTSVMICRFWDPIADWLRQNAAIITTWHKLMAEHNTQGLQSANTRKRGGMNMKKLQNTLLITIECLFQLFWFHNFLIASMISLNLEVKTPHVKMVP